MKRKSILSVLLMLFMVVSLVGCGNKKVSAPPVVDAETTTDAQDGTKDESETEEVTEAPTSEQTEDESESAKEPTEEVTEAPTEDSTSKPTQAPTIKPTQAPTTKPTEAPTTAPEIEYELALYGAKEGYLYFKYQDPHDLYMYRTCVYDVKNKTVKDLAVFDDNWIFVDKRYIRNNAYIGETPNLEINYLKDTAIINACTGEVIYRLKDNQELLHNMSYDSRKAWSDNNTVLVCQRDSSYKGDTYSLGVLNEKGEWVMPLKSDSALGTSAPKYRYLGDTYYFLECYKEDYILNSADGTFYKCPEEMEIFGYYNGKVFAKNSWRSIGLYDFKNDQYTVISEVENPQDAKWDSKFWNDIKYADENGFWYKMENTVYCVDAKNNIKLSYDLSEYRDHVVKAVTKDYIVFWFRNPSSVPYTAVMNTKGELLAEPVNLECDKAVVCNEGVVLGAIDYGPSFRVVYFYDSQKNTITAIDGNNEYKYCDGTNMFWSYTDKCLYKVNDLSTPINVYDTIFDR